MRDMVPNHVFQLLSLIAMEPPNSFAADAVRTEKTKVLEAVVPLKPEDVHHSVVRGQYITGSVLGHPVPGYRDSEGVAADSMTETYVAMRLGIDNWRWAGVPFYLRTGKAMARRTSEISIHFKNVPFALFRETPVDSLAPNVLTMQIQPDACVLAVRRQDARAGDPCRRRPDEFSLQGLLPEQSEHRLRNPGL